MTNEKPKKPWNRSLGEGCPNGKFSEERCVCVRARGLCDGEAADARWANPGLRVYCCFCSCSSCPDLGLGFVSVLSRRCLVVVSSLSRCCLAPPPPNSLSPNGWRYRYVVCIPSRIPILHKHAFPDRLAGTALRGTPFPWAAHTPRIPKSVSSKAWRAHWLLSGPGKEKETKPGNRARRWGTLENKVPEEG